MSDIGDTFKAIKEIQKEKKDKFNTEKLPALLQMLDYFPGVLEYEVKNDGYHYIVKIKQEGKVNTVDLWPTSGKWQVRRKGSKINHGLVNMLKYFKLPIENSSRYILSEN